MADNRDKQLKEQSIEINEALKASADDDLELRYGGQVQLSHLDKVLVTTEANNQTAPFTKRQLLQYYAVTAPLLLPHLIDRPLTLKRYPDGFTHGSFLQRHIDNPPDFIHTIEMYSDAAGANHQFVLCQNLASLMWMTNQGAIEFHPWFSRINPDGTSLPTIFINSTGTLELSVANYPDMMVFDLDSAQHSQADNQELLDLESSQARSAFDQVRSAAFLLHAYLDQLGLRNYAKTSGKNGIHVVVPIIRKYPFDQVRAAAKKIGKHLAQQHDEIFTMEWQIPKRQGKVFFDFNQNARGKSLASVYSIRPTLQASISMPVNWIELESVYPNDFTVWDFIPMNQAAPIPEAVSAGLPDNQGVTPFSQRVAASLAAHRHPPKLANMKDPWKELLKQPQDLPLELTES